MPTSAPAYRLVRPPVVPPTAPDLDHSQRAVVDHDAGPLLVLAGPGTGKTTTLVEAVVERVRRGASPEDVLVLTFSRKAADELRTRIASRLGRTITEPAAHTFHGFCYAVLRAYGVPAGEQPPRLLSGAERELRVRELLRGNAEGEGRTVWPAQLSPALGLRGFAREVADLLDRARERGLDGSALRRLGVEHDRPVWRAAGTFLDEYLDVLSIRGEVDYASLVGGAVDLLGGPAAELAQRFAAVYIDEYQDTDPSQEQLLRRLSGGGRLLVAVGDPDQSIYGFRGADVRGILEFPDRFRHADGRSAAVTALRYCRRSDAVTLAPSRHLATRIPLGSLTRRREEHRELRAVGPPSLAPPEIQLYPSVAAEVAGIADLLRRSHLLDGVAWRSMAVLVRSGVRSIPVVRRALAAAGVPVAVAADELPLSRDPAVAPLLAGLDVIARGPDRVSVDVARRLLLSPLGGATPASLRALGRRLRALARAAGDDPAPPSSLLIRDAVIDPTAVAVLEPWVAGPVQRLAGVLDAGKQISAAGGSPEEVLWALWSGSGWDRRLTAAAAPSDAAGRAADRDLDAVLALFETATRLADRQPRATVGALLEEIATQEIPAAPYEERATAADAVRLLTAHRSKGLEWDLVVVADVQEGVWPDLRRRSSLLGADELDGEGPQAAPTASDLLVEERRLFYVATTRARRRLVVTATSGVDDAADRPSRFLAELGLEIPDRVSAPGGTLTPASLTARLRRALTSVDSDEVVRHAAARQLAGLAAATDDRGQPLVPAADPIRWWGLVTETTGPTPVRSVDRPVMLSGSAVASFTRCPRAWFLDREAKAREATTTSQGFGSIVHALAEAVAVGDLPAELDALVQRLDTVWGALPYDARWQRVREHDEARAALARFLVWHARNPRTCVAAESDFEVAVTDDIVIRGRADRLELDGDGGLVVVDLKTSKNPPAQKSLAQEPQLGVYQLAVRHGAFAELPRRPGGAELLQLRKETRGEVKVQPQPALAASDTWVDELVATVAGSIREESFAARPNDGCDRCVFRTSCPAHDAGRQVVT